VTDEKATSDEVVEGDLSAAPSPSSRFKAMDPARRITLIVLAVVAVLFAWHIVADRATPYTDLGKVDGYVVPIAPQVSGYVTEVPVVLNQVVEEGGLLLKINPLPFELAVNSARAQLELSGQQVRAQTSAIESAAGRVGVAMAQLDRAQRYFDRVEAIAAQNPGALSQADRDRATTQLAQAEAGVISAEAELDKARETLGVEGQDNPAIRAAAAALAQAEFNLEQTEIHAPRRGSVGDLQLAEGHFAVAGQPLATFISAQDVWVRADMRENNLGRIEIGHRAEVALDVAPGRIFRGHVASVSAGVDTGQGARGGLTTAETTQGWLRDPQRFPVIIRFEGDEARGLLRAGGQASVIVYVGSNPLLNFVGRFRIRLTTLLSYVR
jgi:multidrug resistance efflux pump